MILRILNEGQYRLDSAHLDRLNEMDGHLVEAVASGDEARFRRLLGEMLAYVMEKGQSLAPQDLAASDVVLPTPDITMDEARSLFVGAGVIPG